MLAVASSAADAHNFAAVSIDLDDGRFEQAGWLAGQSSAKRHAPDWTRYGSHSFGIDAVRLKGHVRARNLNTIARRLAGQLACCRPGC